MLGKTMLFFLKHHRGWHLFVAALLFVVLSPFFGYIYPKELADNELDC